MKHIIIRSLAALPAVALLAAVPSVRAADATARVQSNAAESSGDAAKAALKEIDAEIDVLDDAVDNAPTAAEKSAAKARLDALKERRGELRKTYVRSRFDELKADVHAESNRIGSWSKRTYKREPVATADRDVRNATSDTRRDANRVGDRLAAGTASGAAALDLESYKRRATDTDQNEAKAALKALDQRIDALKDKVDNMPKGADRDIAKRRAKALEDRKDQLEKDFNKERFNALVDEVQAEWNNPRH
jgi:chromosome segregation ATPase